MGQLVDGVWRVGWYDPDDKGAFERPKTRFRGRVDPAATRGRYRLYASFACPWAHRALITRAVRGLEDAIPVTIVDPRMGDDGWAMQADDPDPEIGATLLREIYLATDPRYTGRVTVPVLWDREKRTIVNNESREVMRMLDVELGHLATNDVTLAPPHLRAKIDETLDAIYAPINDGVYRAGFATKQGAYEDAVKKLFDALDHWNAMLGQHRFVCGDVFTEADVAMFTTLLRFDLVYYSHFKCNVRRLQDYPNLWGFVRDVYQMPAVRSTCRLDHIKVHYYWSQTTVNPHRIVPVGPTLDLDAPHERGRLAVRMAG